ncbi:hypothetical protein BGZ47_008980 [Haplosporangium gracile]|nr:hypothetical protein BGZ47_008980 [Haplosporangium gracile]
MQEKQQEQGRIRPLPPLPPEILSPIFAYLPRSSLLSCTLVSRLWYHESKPHLFRAETFYLDGLRSQRPLPRGRAAAFPGRPHSLAYIAAIKANKRYLRSATWHSRVQSDFSVADMLDILFDCPRELLPICVDGMDSVDSWKDLDRAAAVAADTIADNDAVTKTTPGSPKVVPGIPLGPNRPALQEFVFEGHVNSMWLLETTIYNLPTLTSLDIHIGWYGPNHPRSICLDIDMILDALPRLKSLIIDGYWHTYADSFPSTKSTTTTSSTETTVQLHPLESFNFLPLLIMRSTANTLATFRRLGNLKSIIINSKDINYNPANRQAQPGEFGQILLRYCPKIERLETTGSWALWLCRLLPSSAACEDIRSLSSSGTGESDEGFDVMLAHQEREDILTNSKEMTLFFPQLKALIVRGLRTLGAQDLFALAVSRSQFLTYLEIGPGDQWNNAFNLHQDTRPYHSSSSSVEGIDQITVYPPGPLTSSEMRWMRKRRVCTNLDYQRVLETCSSLRVVSLPDGIPFRHMVDDSSDTNGVEARMTRSWACEGTIETLTMGFLLSTARRDDHRLIWRHLGRLSKLRCLTLTRSNLIPSLDFGITELVGRDFSQHDDDDDAFREAEGGGGGEGGGDGLLRLRKENPTLEKLHSLGVAWGVDDRATTHWFARSFPNLQTAGLGFRWGTNQHKRVQGWLDEVGCSFELEFTNDRFRSKR